MQKPGRWLLLRKPRGCHLTRAAKKLKAHNAYIHFYHDHGPVCGKPHDRVLCVKWSQDDSFYCCPRDIENDPASGWRTNHEAIELLSRQKQDMYDDFYGYF